MTSTSSKATKYARDVVAGRILTSKKVLQACERHLSDLKRENTEGFPYVFNERLAARPCDFIERYCRPSQGDFKRIELGLWQHFVIGSLYGWVHKDTKLRRFREGLIYVARKNGKTTMIAGLSLYGLSKDHERGARIYQLANSMKQAKVTFDECKAMVDASWQLREVMRNTRDAIFFDPTFSRIEPQAADSERLDGLNAHLGIFDEVHEARNYKLINVIKNSTGARKQPLIVYLTTAGYVLDGPLMDYYAKAADVLDRVITDERYFCYMAELDEDDDVDDPANWGKPNPNLGVTISLEDMIEEWNSRKHIPAERNDFITKRLNLFVQSDEQSFVDFEVLQRNSDVIDLSLLEGKACVGGFDLSNTEDFTAACLEFPLDDGRVFVLGHSFVPERKVKLDNENLPYREWQEKGYLTICPGDYVDHSLVFDWFAKQSKKYTIMLITYDPANAYRLVQDLQQHGGPEWTKVVRQGHFTLSPALKDVKMMLLDGKVVHNRDPLLQWYINNVKLIEDRNGNWLPNKQGKYRKIDGFAAWLNAHTEVLKLTAQQQDSGGVSFMSISDLKGR